MYTCYRVSVCVTCLCCLACVLVRKNMLCVFVFCACLRMVFRI